jgi:hypothetical protein
MPPKAPEGGLIGRDISIIKTTPYKSPFGGFRGQTKKAEKKAEFLEAPLILNKNARLLHFVRNDRSHF